MRGGWLLAGAIVAAALSHGAVAETIKIGISRQANSAPIAIAQAKGYFTAEGLAADLVFFDAQQPIAVGVASGDIDFGIGAETAALYSLAGQGALRIIGGGSSEAPTFHYLGFIASNRAFDAGLTSVKLLPGHTAALTQMGTGLQYALGQVADKYGFDVKRITLLALQSNSNIASALAGGRADAAVFSSTGAMPLLARGDAKLLGWVGDETGMHQANLTFTAAKTADARGDLVRRFLNVYRRATHDYHDAITAADETRHDGPAAPEMVTIISKYLGQPEAMVRDGLPYIDRDARVDVSDVQSQIDWYRAQGLLKGDFGAAAVIDSRYVVPLPAHAAPSTQTAH
jgi:NitT/TauT family transport system substrate-binding protein